MFVDICVPNNNEKKFIEISKKISTKKIIFLYESKKTKNQYDAYIGKKNEKRVLLLEPLKRNIAKNPKQHFFFGDDKKGTFHAPTKINQVLFKELSDKKKAVGIPFALVWEKKPRYIENLQFVVKMCEKYGVPMFVASFAKSPYELRSKHDLASFCKLIGMSTNYIKKSLETLDNLVS